MMLRPIAILIIAILADWSLTNAAEPPDIHETLRGNWLLETAEHNGHTRKDITTITGVEFGKDSLLVRNKIGETFKYKYKLDNDKDGRLINLFPQFGKNQETLIPSRFSLLNGKLLLMLPAYSRLPQLRPSSLKSADNSEFMVLHLVKPALPESTKRGK